MNLLQQQAIRGAPCLQRFPAASRVSKEVKFAVGSIVESGSRLHGNTTYVAPDAGDVALTAADIQCQFLPGL